MPDPLTDAGLRQPEQHLIDLAVEVSTFSPCRSKRGSVIFSGPNVVTHGYNYKPRGFDCDGSAACKATCRTEAIHAEQQALLSAGRKADGAEMLHVKTVDGRLVPSGGPSCVQCSKLALVAGVKAMWLYHADGWRRYECAEWHRLSLAAVDQIQPGAAQLEAECNELAQSDLARTCEVWLWQKRAEAAEARLQALQPYLQHSPTCATRKPTVYEAGFEGFVDEEGDFQTRTTRKFLSGPGPCDCGLATLTQPGAAPSTLGGETRRRHE